METRPRITWQWVVAGVVSTLVVAVFAAMDWYIVELQPADRNASSAVSFELQQGNSVSDIATQLKNKDIIRDALAFSVYVTITGKRSSLQAGHYELNPSDSTQEIATTLSGGRVTRNTLVVPEGATVTKIRLIARDKGITATDFDAALAATYSNDFLAGRPSGDTSLEGYLFPDSYQVSKPVRPRAIIQSMLDNFTKQVNQTDVVRLYAAEGMTLHQGLTLASIVEREAGKPVDQPIIAQVFLKRLKQGMPLQSDVTVEYAAELNNTQFNLSLNSPYNTYVTKGLPPGPIANPGVNAMKAVANPANTDYLYFLADKSGTVHYAKTAAEHEANVQKYLR